MYLVQKKAMQEYAPRRDDATGSVKFAYEGQQLALQALFMRTPTLKFSKKLLEFVFWQGSFHTIGVN